MLLFLLKDGRKHPHQEFIQIDTSNILFICGGAFEGLDNIIKDRIGKKSIGFGASIESKKDTNRTEILKQMLPQDLLKFGMIPEFVGRLPIVVDGVELEFEPEAIQAIVDQAIERNTGARGLRSIIESIMRDIMFDIPSNDKITKCIITKETALNKAQPKIIIDENKKREPLKMRPTKGRVKKSKNKTA